MDMKQIRALMRDFDESGLSKMKISQNDFSMELEKVTGVVAAPVQAIAAAPVAAPAPAAAAAVPAPASASAPVSGDTISSPMVGTFYSSPSPDSPAFVKVGDKVKKGQTLAILEAMKIMNELEAEFDCKILDILAKDGQPVEYDMPLFVIEKL